MNSLAYYYRRTDHNDLEYNVDMPAYDGSTIDRHTTLRIIEIAEANGGYYECVVSNLTDDGDSISLGRRNFTIVVTSKSVIILKSPSVYCFRH